MHVRHPVWLRMVAQPGATHFATMFFLDSLARATMSTVIPLQAYEILGSARDVSVVYTAVGITALAASLLIPGLIRRFRRRWVYSGGAAGLALAGVLVATATLTGQVTGQLVRVFATACVAITLSLYILDYIDRRDLVRSEPRRLLFGGLAWTIGPGLGVWLYTAHGIVAASALSIAGALAALAYFWVLRLNESVVVAPASRPPPSPLGNIKRFAEQKRLRLAWVITFGRSCFWSMFFVYPPLFLLEAGEDRMLGALLVSAGNGLLFLSPAFGAAARRFGVRAVIVLSFVGIGGFTLAAGLAADWPRLAGLLLLGAAVGAAANDAVGNIPFFRFVRAYERGEMTTVFRTYVDVAELATGAAFAGLLTLFPLPSVFVATGTFLLAVAVLAAALPRRL